MQTTEICGRPINSNRQEKMKSLGTGIVEHDKTIWSCTTELLLPFYFLAQNKRPPSCGHL